MQHINIEARSRVKFVAVVNGIAKYESFEYLNCLAYIINMRRTHPEVRMKMGFREVSLQ